MRGFLPPSAKRPRKRNAPRPSWKVADAFRQRIRKYPCACGGRNPNCGGDIQSAHVDYAAKGTPDAKGTSSKVADRWSIPLSRNCHELQHNIGWPRFEKNYLPGRAEAIAAELWDDWVRTPSGRKWTENVDHRYG